MIQKSEPLGTPLESAIGAVGIRPTAPQSGGTCAALAITLTLALLAAYPLARIAFPGQRLLLFAVIATSMFPQVAVLAGLYEMFTALGLYNTLPAVVLADLLILLPFTLWLMTAYMRALPRELEDIAVIDGAGPLVILFKVYLPLIPTAPMADSRGVPKGFDF